MYNSAQEGSMQGNQQKSWAASWQNQQNGCAPSEDWDQPGHPPSLISLRCPHEEALGAWLAIERTAKTDQTGRMPRLIRVFAGRTYQFVGFVMRRLN